MLGINNVRDQLLLAQSRAAALFVEVEQRGLIRAGESEESISEAIFELGATLFGARKHWHRRVIRAGVNTRLPYADLPPNRSVEHDDIVSIDLGPVFDDFEADFGRTYVVGNDPEKLRLRDALRFVFDHCKDAYLAAPSMTGAELYELVVRTSAVRGWGFGGAHAGHLVGPFPVSKGERGAAANRIRPDNHTPMDRPDASGRARFWILEIHLLDPTGRFGGFFEEGLNF